MASTFGKYSSPKSDSNKIVIPNDILREIELIPDKRNNQKVVFAKWEDEILIKYGKIKSLKEIAKILNKKPTAVTERYKYLFTTLCDKIEVIAPFRNKVLSFSPTLRKQIDEMIGENIGCHYILKYLQLHHKQDIRSLSVETLTAYAKYVKNGYRDSRCETQLPKYATCEGKTK